MTDHQNGKPWSSREVGIAARIWQSQYADHYGDDEAPRGAKSAVFQTIATALECSYSRIAQRHTNCGPSFIVGGGRGYKVSPQAMAERDARKHAENFRNLTASTFGDPPPGYSALDRRKSQGAGR